MKVEPEGPTRAQREGSIREPGIQGLSIESLRLRARKAEGIAYKKCQVVT